MTLAPAWRRLVRWQADQFRGARSQGPPDIPGLLLLLGVLDVRRVRGVGALACPGIRVLVVGFWPGGLAGSILRPLAIGAGILGRSAFVGHRRYLIRGAEANGRT